MSRRCLVGWIVGGLLALGVALIAGCGSPVYYSSSSGGGYYGNSGWNDPWYRGSCCRGDYGRPNRPHRPPGMRPPGHRPPGGGRPPGMRPPGHRPPGGGRPPGIPSRPRPTPRRR